MLIKHENETLASATKIMVSLDPFRYVLDV